MKIFYVKFGLTQRQRNVCNRQEKYYMTIKRILLKHKKNNISALEI